MSLYIVLFQSKTMWSDGALKISCRRGWI